MQWKGKLMIFGFIFLIGYLLVVQFSVLFPFLFEGGGSPLDQIDGVRGVMLDTLVHPIDSTLSVIHQNVPIFYAGVIAVLLYATYVAVVAVDKSKKEGWEVEKKEQSYGSAHLAAKKEIINQTQFIGASKQELFEELKQSMASREND